MKNYFNRYAKRQIKELKAQPETEENKSTIAALEHVIAKSKEKPVINVNFKKIWARVLNNKSMTLPGWYDISLQITYNHTVFVKVFHPTISAIDINGKINVEIQSPLDTWIESDHPLVTFMLDPVHITKIQYGKNNMIIDAEGARICIDCNDVLNKVTVKDGHI